MGTAVLVLVTGVVLGGWSSNNKYSLMGALRTAAKMISYELPMGLALISILLLASRGASVRHQH